MGTEPGPGSAADYHGSGLPGRGGKLDFEVVVVGGGSAGLAAAVSAARTGARTLLLEKGGCLGGMAPASLVHSICGLYRLSAGATAQLANPGFASEFAGRLIRVGGASGPVRMGRVDVLLQHPTAFAGVADAIALETPLLEVRLHSELIALSGDLKAGAFSCRGQRESFSTRTMVDASGDAMAAALGGAATECAPSDFLQRPAFIFGMHGIEGAALDDEGRLKIARRITTAVQGGLLPKAALGAALRGTGRAGEAFVTIDLEAPQYDPLDGPCLTRLEMHGRGIASALAEFLHNEVPGFEQSFISAFPTRIGVRESRRILGQYRLETADMEQGRDFEDGVALATWPMEMRETHRGPRLRFPDNGQPCAIPLRALRARDHQNLFAAGRCIACSHEAQASIRVIGTCLATGEAAGIAAARLALTGECSAADVRAVREQLHVAREVQGETGAGAALALQHAAADDGI